MEQEEQKTFKNLSIDAGGIKGIIFLQFQGSSKKGIMSVFLITLNCYDYYTKDNRKTKKLNK